MQYAVIKTGGKQYKVYEGETIEVDRLSLDKDGPVSFSQVLLWVNDGQVLIGAPVIPDIKVTGKILDHIKGEKIRVSKFKAKARYRRVMGFRPFLTRVQITKIETNKKAQKKSSGLTSVKSQDKIS